MDVKSFITSAPGRGTAGVPQRRVEPPDVQGRPETDPSVRARNLSGQPEIRDATTEQRILTLHLAVSPGSVVIPAPTSLKIP
jgi:hypothetical protein